MASEDASIPRYLRYKTEHERGKDCWDDDIERANKILHNRIIRIHQDKLCEGCARFDWWRTHFYTREVRLIDQKDTFADQKVGNDTERPVRSIHGNSRNLENIEDEVVWSQFEVVPGARQEALWLAKHPRFRWRLGTGDLLHCMLCKSLYDEAEAATGLMTLRTEAEAAAELVDLRRKHNSTYVEILLRGGPVFEDEGKHQCIEVSSYL
jgi:hypothetical protein